MSEWRQARTVGPLEAAARRSRDAAGFASPSDLAEGQATQPAATTTQQSERLVDPADLIGAAEVCGMCGWRTRKSIGDHKVHGFPEPVATVSGTRLWTRTAVKAWKDARP